MESKEVILENAYRAEYMKVVCETAVMLAKDWPEDVLQALIIVPGLLEYLYTCWIKTEDSLSFEMDRCIKRASAKIARSYRETVQGEKAA